MHSSTALNIALQELTAIQCQAVEWDEGPMLLLAGPGSGKTRVLTCRIARLLDDNKTDNFRVLGLTFTNKAADEMRTRIHALTPDESNRLFLGTFHSFCAEILRQHGAHVGIKSDFRIYGSERDLEQIMEDAISLASAQGEDVQKSDAAFLPVIQRMKAELIRPEDAPANVPGGIIKGRIESAYRAYENQLRAINALDFNSLIYYSWELFQQFPQFATRYQNVYTYWCIDEFQDTNKSQFELIRALAGKTFKNIFAVADDDQIIYQWNGASYQRFEEFRSLYEPALIQLPTNYRCPAAIVTIANLLINHNQFRSPGKKPLEAAKPRELGVKPLGVMKAPDEMGEGRKIAKLIAERYADNLGGVAVLARNKKLLDITKTSLESAGVKAVISQRKDEFSSAPFIWLHSCLRLANRPRDIRALKTVSFAFQKLSEVETDVEGIVSRAETLHGNYFRQWLEEALTASKTSDVRGVLNETVRTLLRASNFELFIAASLAWFESPRMASFRQNDDLESSLFAEDLNAWEELYPEIRSALAADSPLEIFLQELDLRSKAPSPSPDSVVLMTIHAAKGKEFDHVILQGLAEDLIPSFQSKKKGDKSPEMEEERRNCFVAITRAKKTLVLSYAHSYFGWSKDPSRFFFEMGLAQHVSQSD